MSQNGSGGGGGVGVGVGSGSGVNANERSSSARARNRNEENEKEYRDRNSNRDYNHNHNHDHSHNRDSNREHREHRDRDHNRDNNNTNKDRDRGSHRRHRRQQERSNSRERRRSVSRDENQQKNNRGKNYGIVSDDEHPKTQSSVSFATDTIHNHGDADPSTFGVGTAAGDGGGGGGGAGATGSKTTNTAKNNGDKERDFKDQQQRKKHRKKKGKRKEKETQSSSKKDHRDRDRDRDRERADAHRHSRKRRSRRDRNDKRNDRHHKDRRYRNVDDDGSYNTAGKSVSSRDIDDSIGHFEGGPDTVIDNRYKIVKDVGMGTFGRVVQAFDLKVREHRKQQTERERDKKGSGGGNKSRREDEIVAIKIVRNVKRYHQSALIEADILKDVNSRGGRGESLCAVMKRHFEFDGHCCLVFEKLGRNLYDYMKRHNYEPFPLYCVRDFARQLLDALDFIHGFGLIHTDLKPENILLTSNKEKSFRNGNGSRQQVPASTSIKLIDFGGATYDNEKKSSIINTRQYRAPEVILGLGWSTPSDLWSAGCIISELYLGELLFATHDNSEHLALIEKIIGRFPLDMLTRSKEFGSTVFDSFGFHKLDLPAESKEHVRSRPPLESIVNERDQTSGLVGLLKSLLMIDPAVRATAGDALKATFFDTTHKT